MTLLSYAEDELNRIGLTDEDEYNGMMRNHILHMVKVFADEGHSGFSAPYAIGWTSSTIKNALFDLNQLKQDLN